MATKSFNNQKIEFCFDGAGARRMTYDSYNLKVNGDVQHGSFHSTDEDEEDYTSDVKDAVDTLLASSAWSTFESAMKTAAETRHGI